MWLQCHPTFVGIGNQSSRHILLAVSEDYVLQGKGNRYGHKQAKRKVSCLLG